MGDVTPNASLRKLEETWCALFDRLQREPALWNSFEVLDDLVMAVDALEVTAAIDNLLVPLAERAAELLRLLLEGQSAVRVT